MDDAQLIIRTHERDLRWLGFCLESVKRYWSSALPTIILATPSCDSTLGMWVKLTHDTLIYYEEPLSDRRRGAVYLAMQADRYSRADLIAFIDSDCIFQCPTTTKDLLTEEGRIIVYATPYDSFRADAQAEIYAGYRRATTEVLHYDFALETMQQFPILYRREEIRGCREMIERLSGNALLGVMTKYPSNIFSEFNLFGAYANLTAGSLYEFREPLPLAERRVKNYNSWHQNPLDEAIQKELRAVIQIT